MSTGDSLFEIDGDSLSEIDQLAGVLEAPVRPETPPLPEKSYRLVRFYCYEFGHLKIIYGDGTYSERLDFLTGDEIDFECMLSDLRSALAGRGPETRDIAKKFKKFLLSFSEVFDYSAEELGRQLEPPYRRFL